MQPEFIYFIAISVVAWVCTSFDKSQAKHKRWRIKESTLFTLAFLGGALAMYVTMILIRHKTKHKRFMIGLPLLILGQLSLVIWLFYSGTFS